MKRYKVISVMLSAALLGAMLNVPVLAEEPTTNETERVAYKQNFDNCDWFNDDGTIADSKNFTRSPFFGYLDEEKDGVKNLVTTYSLDSVEGKALSDADKSLHINARFNLPFGKQADGNNVAANSNDWCGYIGDWNQGGAGSDRGNNGVSHRMELPAETKEMAENEKFMHISFGAAQSPMPPVKVYGNNGAGLEVLFDFRTRNGKGDLDNADNIRGLEWSNENRQIAFFDDYRYEVGAPNTAPMTAGNWIYYDYVINADEKTLDLYLNGFRVINDLDISGKIKKGGQPSPIEGLNKLNFQVRDMNTGDISRNIDVYVDDIAVVYSESEPVVSPKSVFGEKANINVPDKYVNNEAGIIYNYGQSLDDMKQFINADGGDKKVDLVAKKYGGGGWTETTTSLDSREVQGKVENSALYVWDGKFYYCYEVKQPKDTELQAAFTETDGSAALTWSGAADNCKKVEIFKDGEKVAECDRTDSYTNAALTAATVHEYRVRELLPDNDVSVFVAPRLSDGTTVVYAENFDNRTWWEENGTTPNAEQFSRTPFYKNMDTADIMETAYALKAGQSGRESTDKSLHINAKFKHTFGLDERNEKLPHSTQDGQWNGGFGAEADIPGNNGVSHRMTVGLKGTAMTDADRYLRVSFATAKSVSDLGTIAGEQGAGFDVSFDFITEVGDAKNKEMLHWYPGNKQGVFGKFYQVRAKANAWVYYDYVFDTQTKTMDIYVNGYPTVKARDISNEIKVGNTPQSIKGISKLNFQVRDMNTDAKDREIDVYVDDVKVTYATAEPMISPYSIFGEAAKIDAPEKYVNNEAGEIYNYGQTFEDVKKYITGEGESTKIVSLVREADDSSEGWQKLVTYESQSLDAVRLNDGRYVSPILYVEDGNFTYRYKIVQDISYDVQKNAAAIQSEKDYTGGVTVVFAAYQNGKLTSTALQTTSLTKGSNIVVAGESFVTDGAQEIKIMVWNDLDSLHPLYRDLQMTLQQTTQQ